MQKERDRKRVATPVGIVFAAAMLVAALAQAQRQQGLVNVSIEDVTLLLPVATAATICGVNPNLLGNRLGMGPTACRSGTIALANVDGGVPTPDGGVADAAMPDAGRIDAGISDAGMDACMTDAGSMDAGTVDAGRMDAGMDAGIADAGRIDAGPMDAGIADAGMADAGMADAGARDGGVVSPPPQTGFVYARLTNVDTRVSIAVAATLCGLPVNVLVQRLRQGPVDCREYGRAATMSR